MIGIGETATGASGQEAAVAATSLRGEEVSSSATWAIENKVLRSSVLRDMWCGPLTVILAVTRV
ncbi:hypothetical protein FRC19_007218, partial [Serendipita sp. 401]